MMLIFGIAGAAAVSVVLYNHWSQTSPELASLASRRVQQLASVVLVLAKAVEAVVEALQGSMRPQMAASYPASASASSSASPSWHAQPLVDSWRDFDDED